jgi:hypothetical protein
MAPDPTGDRIAKLERELESLRSGRRWQTAALWALFILLVASAIGAVAYVYKSADDLRRDASSDRNTITKRIDDTSSSAQSRIDSKADALDGRANLIVQDVASLSAENAALRARLDAFEQYCGGSCMPPTK